MNSIDHIKRAVARLEPGQQIKVSRHLLRDCEPPAAFAWITKETAADRILENIVGSAYEFWYEEDPMDGNMLFGRLKEPLTDGRRTYVSPDRRHDYRKEWRFWCPVKDKAEP